MRRPTDGPRGLRWLARVGIPLLLLIAAAIARILGSGGLAAIFAMVALVAFAVDRIVRLGLTSQRDRDEERTARRTLRREGHWPGELPPTGGDGRESLGARRRRPRE